MLGYGYYYDPTYILVLIGALLSLWASAKVKSTYSRYAKVYSRSGLTGAEAAQQILRNAGIYGVRVEHISGNLTDHYDPKAKVLRLSDSVYGSRSVAAVGVAAHECGHAVQHQVGYVPLSIRSVLVPVANFGSSLSWPIFVAGLIFSIGPLLDIGIILFLAAVLFQVVTLRWNLTPRKSLRLLDSCGILGPAGDRRHEEGADSGCPHLCGKPGGIHFTAAAAFNPGRRKTEK